MSSGFTTKVYVVQKANGKVVGTKLTFLAAQRLAKNEAPARVIFSIADKTDERNIPAPNPYRKRCN